MNASNAELLKVKIKELEEDIAHLEKNSGDKVKIANLKGCVAGLTRELRKLEG